MCPSCRHYLRFEDRADATEVTRALQVEGEIRHPAEGGAWEYSVVLTIRDDEGNEVSHQVVGVGAIHPGDARTFTLAVELTPTNDLRRLPRRPNSRPRH